MKFEERIKWDRAVRTGPFIKVVRRKMKFLEALEKAKETAFNDYDDECKRHNSDTGYNATRTWKKFVREDGIVIYSLSGTPPKAYLIVFPNKTTIHCKRSLEEDSFKVFYFEGEPSGSPSLGGKDE